MEFKGFGIDGAMGHPNGDCPQHGPKINRNGLPWCPRCAAIEAKANAKPVGEIRMEDPGEDAIKVFGLTAASGRAVVSKSAVVTAGTGSIEQALSVLRSMAMPKDLKTFKLIQKSIALLEKAAQDEE